jgi:hypothetical protein
LGEENRRNKGKKSGVVLRLILMEKKKEREREK